MEAVFILKTNRKRAIEKAITLMKGELKFKDANPDHKLPEKFCYFIYERGDVTLVSEKELNLVASDIVQRTHEEARNTDTSQFTKPKPSDLNTLGFILERGEKAMSHLVSYQGRVGRTTAYCSFMFDKIRVHTTYSRVCAHIPVLHNVANYIPHLNTVYAVDEEGQLTAKGTCDPNTIPAVVAFCRTQREVDGILNVAAQNALESKVPVVWKREGDILIAYQGKALDDSWTTSIIKPTIASSGFKYINVMLCTLEHAQNPHRNIITIMRGSNKDTIAYENTRQAFLYNGIIILAKNTARNNVYFDYMGTTFVGVEAYDFDPVNYALPIEKETN